MKHKPESRLLGEISITSDTDTILMAESEEKLKSLLMKVKGEREKVGLKLNIQNFAVIFSHSESFLFTLLIVSFIVQKLLSLIRSHLFIFVFISITQGGGS